MTALLERLGVERPVIQAGMGGGVARHELAAAVSDAGGLGTLGTLEPGRLREELEAARRLTGAPLAINLLLPFAGARHHEVAAGADVVVTFWGRPQRRSARTWIHQCGSVEEARTAHAAGADAVIAQGVEAGGHVRGTTPALELLERVKPALPRDFPVLLAGGVAEAADVRAALDAGAAAAVLGTRFLLSEESHAHPAYKRAALAADDTVLTDLFGLGWPGARHRVLANAATSRWCTERGGVSPAVRAAQRALSPFTRVVPESAQRRFATAQRPGVPLLSPLSPVDDAPCGRLLEAGALYAGETVARIAAVRPAADVVAELAH
ncbi:MAG TPA: nitronate monooxygenase [Thermoleophilaceae bacterium]|nr:nitronate monooxygenase [Thermoleophilaceae bacterium]